MEKVKNLPRAISKLHKNIVPLKAQGSWVTNYTGEHYLDLTSGIGALSTGHSHPKIIKKVSQQVKDYVHIPQQVFQTHPTQIELNKKMLSIMPAYAPNLDTFFYTNSGSEAVDNALKIAKTFTGRQNIISLNKGFHGRTMGALSITSSNISCRQGAFPMMPGVFVCQENTINSLNNLFEFHISPTETAAIIVETTQGEGGIYTLSQKFLDYIRDICDIYNIVLIIDEVQCGAGRTGAWWNIEQKKIKPDLMLFGKGIASGFPFAGIVGSCDIMDCGDNFLGGTYGGNAVSSAAASATIDIINNENLLINSETQGNYLKINLQNNKFIKEIRQYGLMIAIELKNSEYDLIDARNIVSDLNNLNVLTLLCGNKSQYIRLLPPLNVNKREIDIFIKSFNDVTSFYDKYN